VTIHLKCSCGAKLQTNDANVGKRLKCPKCGVKLLAFSDSEPVVEDRQEHDPALAASRQLTSAEATIRENVSRLHPISREVCCDVSARLFLKPDIDFKSELFASYARAGKLDHDVSGDDPFVELVGNDLGTLMDTILLIRETALQKARDQGSFDLGTWLKSLGL
jgi:hypothetical protein